MTEKDNLEKRSGEREDQGRVGNLECALSDSAEPEAYQQPGSGKNIHILGIYSLLYHSQ